MGFNGIMSGIKDFVLGEQYSDKKVAYLWNNISKLSVGGRKGVLAWTSQEDENIRLQYLYLLRDDMEVFFLQIMNARF